jgi:iron complex outermembrane receptor protein
MSNFTKNAVMFCLLMVFCTGAVAQQASVSGRVVDGTGTALVGATIQIKGSQRGASTNQQGEFRLEGVPLGNITLEANMLGYSSAEESLKVIDGNNVVNFTLELSVSGLDEIVIIGYGVAKKKQVTGSISSVDSRNSMLAW